MNNKYGNPYNGLEAARAKAIDEATQRLEVKYDREMGPMPAGLRNDCRFFAVQIATRWRKWHAVVAESG